MDYAVTSNGLISSIVSFKVRDLKTLSDHCPISLTLIAELKLSGDSQNLNTSIENLEQNLTERYSDSDVRDNNAIINMKCIDDKLANFKELLSASNFPIDFLESVSSNCNIDKIVESYNQSIIDIAIQSGFGKTNDSHLHQCSNVTKKKNHYYKNNDYSNWYDGERQHKKEEVKEKLSQWRNK